MRIKIWNDKGLLIHDREDFNYDAVRIALGEIASQADNTRKPQSAGDIKPVKSHSPRESH